MESDEVTKLSSTHPELVQYFALPYVSDPNQHPVFKELFTRERTHQLRDKLIKEISKRTGKPQPQPTSSPHPENMDDRSQPPTEHHNHHSEYEELKEDYKRLVDIATELVGCLEQNCVGGTVSGLLNQPNNLP